MHFRLVDRVLERTDDSIVTIKLVTGSEEYLQDHFPTFPVLPGVFMLEAMVQAARELLDPGGESPAPIVLGRVRALKYGTFVRPGDTLRSALTVQKREDGGVVELRGEARVIAPDAEPGAEAPVACSGRLTMRPARLGGPAGPGTDAG